MRTRCRGKSRRDHPLLHLEALEERWLPSSLPNVVVPPVVAEAALVDPEAASLLSHFITSAPAGDNATPAPVSQSPAGLTPEGQDLARHFIGVATDPNAGLTPALNPFGDVSKPSVPADVLAAAQQFLKVVETLQFAALRRVDPADDMYALDFDTSTQNKGSDAHSVDGFTYWLHCTEAASHGCPLANLTQPRPPADQLLANSLAAAHAEAFLAEARPEPSSPELRAAPQPVPLVSFPRVVAVAVEAAETPVSPPAPQSAQLAGGWALNVRELEQAFREFLSSMGELEQDATHWLVELGPTPWVFMGLALVGTLYGTRRLRQPHEDSREAEYPSELLRPSLRETEAD